MQARPYGNSVHSSRKSNQVTPARRLAILFGGSHRSNSSPGNAADELVSVEQGVDQASRDLDPSS